MPVVVLVPLGDIAARDPLAFSTRRLGGLERAAALGFAHVLYVKNSGTMKGDFMGMPASGKRASWDEVHIARAAGGKLAEHWQVIDQLSMLQQLGFVPEPQAV